VEGRGEEGAACTAALDAARTAAADHGATAGAAA
jgi:hypothetical protein